MTRHEQPASEEHEPTLVLGTGRIPLTPTTHCKPLTQTPLPRIPTRLGGYEVRRELGRGGMGIVYEGYDPKLRRSVALKVLKDSESLRPDHLQRFRTEAEAAAQLQHPHIVQVIEVGLNGEQPFVALEYLSGGSLHQRIGGKPMPPRLAAEQARDLADAAAHAHDHGVLHRDLKPANVLFTAEGTPKITDFGAARFLADDHSPEIGLTRAGEVIGTPQYMAPEQASGDSASVGQSADVYAVGAILYEMLTGRPPFTGVDPYDIIHSVRHEDPIPPRSLQPKVPRDLEVICLKCLEKDPKRRYGSAAELQQDLDRFLAGDTIRARPASAWQKTWARARRHPAGTGVAVGLIVAGIIGIVAFSLQFSETVSALATAQSNADEARTKTAEAEANLVQATRISYRNLIAQTQLLIEQSQFEQATERLAETPEHLRNWEYYYLRGLTDDQLWDFSVRQEIERSSTSWINHLVLSPNGRLLAVAMYSPYDVDTEPQKTSYLDLPTSLGFLDTETGRPVFWFKDLLTGPCSKLSWWDDRSILIVTRQGTIQVREIETGRIIREWKRNSYETCDAKIIVNATLTRAAWHCAGGRIEVVDLTDRTPVLSLAVDYVDPVPTTLSADGRWLVIIGRSSDDHGGQQVIDLATGAVRQEIEANWISMIFSPDSRRAVTSHLWYENARPYTKLTVWKTDDWTPLWSRMSHVVCGGNMYFSPSGERFAVHSGSGREFYDYDTETGRQHATFRGHVGNIHAIRYSPDNRWIVSVSDDQTVRLWNPDDGWPVAVLAGHQHSVRSAAFSADGRALFTGGADESVICWNLSKPHQFGGIMPSPYTPGAVTEFGTLGFSPTNELITVSTRSGLVRYDPATANPLTHVTFDAMPARHQKELSDYNLSANGRLLAGRGVEFGPNRPSVSLWDTQTGKLLKNFDPNLAKLYAVALSPDGSRIAATGFRRNDGQPPQPALIVWDAGTGALLFERIEQSLPIAAAFDPVTDRLIVGFHRPAHVREPAVIALNGDGTVAAEMPSFVEPSAEGSRYQHHVNTFAMSPNGRWIAAVCWGMGKIVIADRQTLVPIAQIPTHDAVTSLAFNPDSSRLASTTYTDHVTLYSTVTWDKVVMLVGERGRIDDYAFPGRVAFSPDGRTLAATHWNGNFTIWHVEHLEQYPERRSSRKEVARATSFHFHLRFAQEGVRKNDTQLFRFHMDALRHDTPPTPALREEWIGLLKSVSPETVVGTVAGAAATLTPMAPHAECRSDR